MPAGSELPPLICAMLEAGFYSHSITSPITLIQTHISYVTLAGDVVYKIKKPVDFGFLNFTTIERRRHACVEEVRRNQPGAPDVYLRVDPISRKGDRFVLGDASNVVEYAVVMRRLPQEGLFSNLLSDGKLSADRVEKLAKTLADYHAAAPRVGRERKLGSVQGVQGTMGENYEHTERFVGTLQPREQFGQTKTFTDGQFRQFHDLIERRLEAGFVRECHGDLHLANICLWNDRVILFDCIEFNDAFRCIDVIQDASFVAMDLRAAHRSDLAALFINAYIERTGDFEGLQLLPLYLCRQAYVRAKVNSLLSESDRISGDDKQHAIELARAYYRQAARYALPRQGKIILTAGISGSGKSTVARQLAMERDAIHIRSDAVRKHIAGIAVDQPGGSAIYTDDMTERTYARMLTLGAMLAGQGFTVILDAKYDRRRYRYAVIEQVVAMKLDIKILHCVAPAEELRRRVAARTGDISDATVELLDKQERQFESFQTEEMPYVKIVDTTQAVDGRIAD